jgi:WD40 repeat protein
VVNLYRICIGICRGHTWVATSLENRNGNLISGSADGSVRTWDWKDGSPIQALDPAHASQPGRQNAVRGVVFTSRYMITGGTRDGLLKVWDQESNVLLSEHEAGVGIWNVIGAEGKLVVVSASLGDGPHRIMLWDKMTIDSKGF